VVGSPRRALEGALLLPQFAGLLGAGFLCYFAEEEEGERSAAAVSLLSGENAASLADVRGADCVAILDCDLREEGAMALLAVRQAWRNGAPVFLVGTNAPLEQARAVAIEAVQLSFLEEAPLGIFERPVVVCGTRHSSPAAIERLRQADAKIACLLPGPNAFGAALLAREHGGTSLSAALAGGKVKGVVAVEADIPAELLEGLSFVAALDWLPSGTVEGAAIVLPTTAWVETDGTFVNNEGRAQRFKRAMTPGLPLRGLAARYHASADKPAPFHPPRVHRREPPGSDPGPAWQVMSAIMERLGGEPVGVPLSGRWEPLRDLDPEGEGVRVWDTED
jgi:NADH-quinone oxidoreductase subunit G